MACNTATCGPPVALNGLTGLQPSSRAAERTCRHSTMAWVAVQGLRCLIEVRRISLSTGVRWENNALKDLGPSAAGGLLGAARQVSGEESETESRSIKQRWPP